MSSSDQPRTNAKRRPDPQLDATQMQPSDASQMDATVVPDTVVQGGDMKATRVPSKPGSESLSRTKTATGPNSRPVRAPADGAAIGPQGRKQLGDFQLIRKLGQGGMGEVFLAHQVTLDRQAALKVLAKHLADNQDFVKRFYREARSMAKIDHPQTVRVYDVSEDDGIHYVAMEFIDGKSVQDWLKALGMFSVGDAVHIALRCAEALQQAHAINLVHRDIKPDNIMLTKRGQVKVADFGLAKALDDEEMSMTQSGTGLGTPYYMAPEQARNAKHVDGRSDIYALGVTLYHCLTGQLPFVGESAMEVIMAKEKGRFTSPRRFNPEVTERLELIIDKMLAKDPAQRFQDCGEVVKMLGGLGLENPSLSFIDAPDKVETRTVTSSASQSRLNQNSAASGRQAVSASGRMSASAASARTQVAESTEQQWMVEFRKPDGQKTVSRWSTSQVLNALRSGAIDNRAKVKKEGTSSFIPIAQYPEFAQTVQGILIKQQADRKGGQARKLLQDYNKQQFRYGVKKWFRGLFSNVMGLVSLVVYLALIVGLVYGAWWGWQTYGNPQTPPAAQPTGSIPALDSLELKC